MTLPSRAPGRSPRRAARPATGRPPRPGPAARSAVLPLALALAAAALATGPAGAAGTGQRVAERVGVGTPVPAARSGCPAASDLLAGRAVTVRRPAPGVAVRTWHGHDGVGGRGHPVRLTVAEADLRRVRVAAASGSRFGTAATTAELTAAARAVAGVNGDYFGYDWSGKAVPYGPLVRGRRILRLPPGVHTAVGADTAGRPVAGGVRAAGAVGAGTGPGRWSLPVGSVNDDGLDGGERRGEADTVALGRAVAVVTPYLGAVRPRRAVEVVVRRGAVAAVGRRLPFGPRARWGSGRAGQRDVLLAASGAAGARLRTLRPGAAVTVGYAARFEATGGLVRDAVGSGAALLRDGHNLASCSRSAVRSRPRTMIAWNAARTRLWLLVVGARGPGVPVSRYGLSYRQVTEVARSLGASEAVMVDGGGSSTMAVRSGRQVRRADAPAGVPQRPVVDALVLVRR